MKEPMLKLHNNDDPTLVKFETKERAKILKETQELALAANELYTRLKEDKLEKGFSETILSLLESYTVKIHNSFNYQSVIKKEYEERYKEIRNTNIQNRELRKQLGDKVSSEDVREKIKNLSEIIRNWWRKEGCGHIKDIDFLEHVCRVNLSCSIFSSLDSEQKEERPKKLCNKGYELAEPERDYLDVIHSENNIKLLYKEIKDRFPTAKVSNIKLSDYLGLHIEEIEFIIYDYTEIDEK